MGLDLLATFLAISAMMSGLMVGGRLERIERNLNFILEKLEIESPDLPSERVKALIKSGKHYEAMRCYRRETGVDLRTAKERIEKFERLSN